MSEAFLSSVKDKMEKALEALKKEFGGLRTGRASVNLLDPIKVEAYGSSMPISQVGNINIPEPRMLTIQVWDKALVQATEKAIRESDLGLNPMSEGQTIRIPMPQLSQERREELVKVAAKYAEQARVAVRSARRDGMDALKKIEKEENLSEDDKHRISERVQHLTDDYVKKVDEALLKKEEDIRRV